MTEFYIPQFHYRERSEMPQSADIETSWKQGYNAAIRHFEHELGCETIFAVNDGLIGLAIGQTPDSIGLAHTSFHSHPHGQTFLILSGSGTSVVASPDRPDALITHTWSAGSIVHWPGGIFHQHRVLPEAIEPVYYLCIAPTVGTHDAETLGVADINIVNIIEQAVDRDITELIGAKAMYNVRVVRGEISEETSARNRLLIAYNPNELLAPMLLFVPSNEILDIPKDQSYDSIIWLVFEQ